MMVGEATICQGGLAPVDGAAIVGEKTTMDAMDPKAIRARIIARGKELQKTQASYLSEAGLNKSFLKEASRGSLPRLDSLAALARVLEVTPEWLAYGGDEVDTVPALRIVGTVEAGVWHEPGAASRRERLPLAPDPRFPADAQFVFEVRGTSMNRVAPPGALLHCLDVERSGIKPRHGDLVVVERARASGEIELSAKRMAMRGGKVVFAAESDDPAWEGRVLDPADHLRDRNTLGLRPFALVLRVIVEHWR